MHLLLLFTAFFIVETHANTTSAIYNEEFRLKKAPGFLFTMPKTLLSGRNETVCLTVHHATPSKCVIDLKLKDKHYFTTRTLSSEHTCFELHVPAKPFPEPQLASVRVQVQLDGVVHSSHSQDPIVVYPNRKLTFIETDRGLYKAGSRVRFRILSLDDNLRPVKNYKIPQVRLKNPTDITVSIWDNVTTELGLAQLEFHLSKEAIEGKWKIETDDETKAFEVNRYIVPRFNVEIQHPKLIYQKTGSVPIRICSQYAFGARVKGAAFVRLSDSLNNMQPVEVIKKLQSNGCADFVFGRDELAFSKIQRTYPNYDPKMQLHITATVTEHGTDKIELSKAKAHIAMKPYTLKLVSDDVFQPGLPYEGLVQLAAVEGEALQGQLVEICYNIAIKKSWNYLNNEQCGNFSVGEGNVVRFQVYPLKSNVIHLHLTARSVNESLIADSKVVVRLYSASSSYILLDRVGNAGQEQFLVQFTTDKVQGRDNLTFFHLIKSRGHLYKLRKSNHQIRRCSAPQLENAIGTRHKFVKNGTCTDHFVLKFKLDPQIVGSYQLLVYYVSASGEIISASKNVQVDYSPSSSIRVKWPHKETVPGGRVSLQVETGTPSLCALSSVDKSVKFFNHGHNFDKMGLFRRALEEREAAESSRKTCVAPAKKSAAALVNEESVWDLRRRRRKRFVHAYSEDFDANDVLNKFGVITISNFHTVTKQCYTGPKQTPTALPVQFLTDQYDSESSSLPDKIGAPIRSHFPETWLWELLPVQKSTQIERHLPHTITNWLTDIYCVSERDGVEFYDAPFEISTFQPFFIDVIAPYSIKRNEILYLHIMAFNYLAHDLPVQITLKNSPDYYLIDPLNRTSVSYCINSNSTTTHIFELRPKMLGAMNLSVLAEVDASYPGPCGPDVVVNKRDVVVKSVLVESEGYPKQITTSALLCVSEQTAQQNLSWILQVPQTVLPETVKSRVFVNADLLGQTIQNMDELLTMPAGCGEQIMASLAPNLYILKYLNATQTLTNALRTKTVRHLKMGYQRILNYAHRDGSFSAFGYHDPMGSMFLTAFVVRTLQQAREHIYVNQKVIDRAVEWIFEHQLENGCFSAMLHVFQDMGGSSTQNSTAGLTAYVILSLLEANIEIPETIQTNAKYCIRGYYNLDKYTLAISSYALFKVNWYEEASKMLKRLVQLANVKNDMMWWTVRESNGSIASDVETTSYVLLSLLHYRTKENLAYAHSIVRWLSSKLSSRGAFKSTQDTVVGLSALIKYSTFISSPINLNVSIAAIGQKHKFSIRQTDSLKSKKITLKEANTQVSILVQGQGCVLVQSVLSYYIRQMPRGDAFKLDIEANSVSNVAKCAMATLAPCFKYTGPDEGSNMAILEVDLPSGYSADRASLYQLIDEANVKMFEEINQKVVLYLTQLTHEQICINFNINEYTIVQSRAESAVKLYDYYKPEFSVLQFYKLTDCKLDNSSIIPDLAFNQSEAAKNVVKRNIGQNTNFNNFHNVDFELNFPDGIEANKPVYVKPPIVFDNRTIGK